MLQAITQLLVSMGDCFEEVVGGDAEGWKPDPKLTEWAVNDVMQGFRVSADDLQKSKAGLPGGGFGHHHYPSNNGVAVSSVLPPLLLRMLVTKLS